MEGKKGSITLQVKIPGAWKSCNVSREITNVWRGGWTYFKVYLNYASEMNRNWHILIEHVNVTELSFWQDFQLESIYTDLLSSIQGWEFFTWLTENPSISPMGDLGLFVFLIIAQSDHLTSEISGVYWISSFNAICQGGNPTVWGMNK